LNVQGLQFVMNTDLFKVGVVVILSILLLGAASFILTHSMTAAMKVIRSAVKYEFKTDSGRLNLISAVLLLFLILFSNLDRAVAIALSPTHVLSNETSEIVPIFLFFVFLTGSLICVTVLEYKAQDFVKNETESVVDDAPFCPPAVEVDNDKDA